METADASASRDITTITGECAVVLTVPWENVAMDSACLVAADVPAKRSAAPTILGLGKVFRTDASVAATAVLVSETARRSFTKF